MSTEKPKLTHCSFCGNSKEVVKRLIISESVAICNDCIGLCNKLLAEEMQTDAVKTTSSDPSYDALEIKKHLDKHVIGQDDAKIVLSVALANHYKRINRPPVGDLEIQKSNILLIGPTGSGKCVTYDTKLNVKITQELYDQILLSRLHKN